MQNVKNNFASSKNVSNFALSKNGEVAPCLPVQVALSQIDKHGDQLSVGGRNVMQSEEKLTILNINIIVSKIKK
jgi:hypothetical protein